MAEQSEASGAANPPCPACNGELTGQDLKDLRCPHCGKDLPPRLGI